ncbi:MAG: ECF-type sigma factor [Isosphaeraceae bacterium]|nr:ECF-type sigma factor [Isosphaeraceae bacterium]
MESSDPSEVTRLIEAARSGDRRAAAEILPLVYDELRRLAAARMASEAPGHTLNPTALVHEAYLRLVGDQRFDGRGHFFAAAAEAMRRILVDHARSRQAAKRGDDRRVTLEIDEMPGPESDDDVLIVHEAIDRLSATEPEVANLVRLRYFGGRTLREAAEDLGVAPRTADAWWAYARAWLMAELNEHR